MISNPCHDFIIHASLKLQFCIFAVFPDTRNLCWGYTIFTDIINGREWDKTGSFPRVTMCDFNAACLAPCIDGLQRVLVMNMIAEKIFIFYWSVKYYSFQGLDLRSIYMSCRSKIYKIILTS